MLRDAVVSDGMLMGSFSCCSRCAVQVVSNHIAQLRPYLACSKAYSIRGALMAATGSVLLQVRGGFLTVLIID
jgi:hypothetical protein